MSEGESTGAGEVRAELDRDIGIVGAVALGVGTMIAAGIFVLSGLAVSNVGAMAIGAFLIAALVASFTAFAYAEFSAIYPESGGGYAYVANTFDTDLTYIVGWSMILGYPASAAFYLASFSDWFYRFIYPVFGIPEWIPFWVSGLTILALLVGLNLKGTEESGKFQIVVTAMKVALILLFLWGGLQAFDGPTIRTSVLDNLTKFRDIGVTSALVFITFFGFEAIATNAEEIEEPGRNVPRAIFISMGAVTIVYTLVVLVVTLAVNDGGFLDLLLQQADLGGLAPETFIRENGEVSMAYAARYYLDFGGNLGFYVIVVGALFSMLSAANATVLAGSRVKLAMSRRDHLPDRFEALHPRFNTPYYAVLFTGTLIVVFVALFTVVFGGGPGSEAVMSLPVAIPLVGHELHLGIDAIAHLADFMLLTGLIAVNVAVVRSRRKYPDLERPFAVPGVPVVPVVAVLANLVLLVNVEPSSFLLGLVAQAVGVVVWFAAVGGGPSEARIEERAPTVVEQRTPERREYRLLVPIANPDHVDQLMRTACDVAAEEGGEVLVMSAVTLPEQTPLSRGQQYVDDRRAVIDRAMEIPGSEGAPEVPTAGVVRIAHHVDEAILHTVAQHDCDAVLMGWSGRRSRRSDIVLGSIVDEVAREADADVLVERIGETVDPVGSILVPTAGGPHAEYAAEIARAIAHTDGARVEVLNVVEPGSDDVALTGSREAMARARETLADVECEEVRIEADDVAAAIVEESGDYDLVIVGATREGLLEQLVFGSIPERVGERADATVIMAKRNLGITSRLRDLLGWY